MIESEEQKLVALYPAFSSVIRMFLEKARSEGMDVGLFEGLRTFERQQELFNLGRDSHGNVVDRHKLVTNARPGHTAHNFGCGADLVFRDEKGNWSWAPIHPWGRLASMGRDMGLDAGFFWIKFPDTDHYEMMSGLKLHEALDLYNKGNLKAVWSELDVRNKK